MPQQDGLIIYLLYTYGMERKWYNEDFNTDTLESKDSLEVLELEETKHEYAELKSKLLVNLVEFIVWVVLLSFCYMYLQSHPAEKTSLFSGVDVIAQKVKIFFTNVTWGNGEDVKMKYKLEQTFDEILSLARSGDCLSDVELEKAEKASTVLKSMDMEEFLEKERTFRTTASLYYTKVKKACSE